MSATASAMWLLYISSVFRKEVGKMPKSLFIISRWRETCSRNSSFLRIFEEAGQGVVVGLVEIFDLIVLLPAA